ncbi:MAG: transcription elongation factor GreA [Pseudomonadota bacterium]
MIGSVPMTPEGLERLKEERKRLISVERPKNVKDIQTAREHGDISENAEFDAAKDRQGIINARLKDIENAIASAQVIDPAKVRSERIVFGATVKVIDINTDEELTYQIVGPFEFDVALNRISVHSPLARALIGKTEGDDVKVQTPNGLRELEIIEVKYC